jgi:hypothetical protein
MIINIDPLWYLHRLMKIPCFSATVGLLCFFLYYLEVYELGVYYPLRGKY